MNWIKLLAFSLGLPLLMTQAQAVEEMQLNRESIKTNKRLIVNANMDLTEEQANGFWPIYSEYQAEIGKINTRSFELINSYISQYDSLDDKTAKSMIKEYLQIEQDRLDLRKSYVKKFDKVLPTPKVIRYLQIENRLDSIIDHEMLDRIPLAVSE